MAHKRTIILHYHLFKNAGTSVDTVLRSNFGDKWVTREFPARHGNNTRMVEDWIRETPEAIAYSSHTMLGPLPQVAGVRILTFMLLRDPIKRIHSAYRFERQQVADTWGAKLAKEHDFEGYVRTRLSKRGDRQCRDFQTHRLSMLVPGSGTARERAVAAMNKLTVVGSVERFDEALGRLEQALVTYFTNYTSRHVQANRSADTGDRVSEELDGLLRKANKDDLYICAALEEMIGKGK